MTRILVINSSASGDASVSRILVDEAVQRLVDAHPDAVVTHRDLDATPTPHLTSEGVSGVRGVAATDAERVAQALSDELIAELFAADTIVIGVPSGFN